MRLLTFAHFGEAQSFLTQGHFKPLSEGQAKLYFNGEDYLILTGEGVEEVLVSLSAACTQLQGKLHEVINFGIAGSLSPKLKINDMCQVRCSYLALPQDMAFASFSLSSLGPFPETQNALKLVDCVSSFKRALTSQEAQHLEYFAPIVDRELWAVAKVCKFHKLPIKAFKLISDQVQASSDSEQKLQLCESVKLNAQAWSDQLFQLYQSMQASLAVPVESEHSGLSQLLKNKKFYFTHSQQHQLLKLAKSLMLKWHANDFECLEKLNYLKLESLEIAPKQRSKELLILMEQALNPLDEKLRQRLGELVQPLKQQGCHIAWSADQEDDSFGLKVQIKNPEHLSQVILRLKQFPYEQIQTLLAGGDLDHAPRE